jgi:hypothetical protein
VITCPRCGTQAVAGQEYCLECGIRLPGPGPVGPARRKAAWVLQAALTFLIALAGAAAAIAATSGEHDSTEVVTATGGFATLPTTSTLPSPAGGAQGIVEWPAGEEGWTIVLTSVPQTQGQKAAMARARQARRKGLGAVGILDSSRFASLHPGYWIVFTGMYASEAEATSALQPARKASRTAAVRHIVP